MDSQINLWNKWELEMEKRMTRCSHYHSAKPDGESLLPIWWLLRSPMSRIIDMNEERLYTAIRCITGMFRVKPPTKVLNNRPRRRLSIRKTSANSSRSRAGAIMSQTKTRSKLLTGYTILPMYCFSHLITSKGLVHLIRNYWELSPLFL